MGEFFRSKKSDKSGSLSKNSNKNSDENLSESLNENLGGNLSENSTKFSHNPDFGDLNADLDRSSSQNHTQNLDEILDESSKNSTQNFTQTSAQTKISNRISSDNSKQNFSEIPAKNLENSKILDEKVDEILNKNSQNFTQNYSEISTIKILNKTELNTIKTLGYSNIFCSLIMLLPFSEELSDVGTVSSVIYAVFLWQFKKLSPISKAFRNFFIFLGLAALTIIFFFTESFILSLSSFILAVIFYFLIAKELDFLTSQDFFKIAFAANLSLFFLIFYGAMTNFGVSFDILSYFLIALAVLFEFIAIKNIKTIRLKR